MTTRWRVLGLALLIVLTSGLLVFGGANSALHAQSDCGDPFAGEDVLFSITLWPDTDFCQHSVPYSQILSGGPPPDGIPPIDNPQFESIEAASSWLQPQSPVLAVEIEGEARAYPLAILTWHEIVNDVVAEVPIAVTYCPLCNSAFVFDRRVGDDVLRFGVSGNLRNSNLLMWDDATSSWWQQFTGEAVVGTYTGTVLNAYPALITGFGAFTEVYPDGQVLSRETGVSRSYGTNPYVGYDQIDAPFLFRGELDRRLPPTEPVLSGFVGGQGIAYPFSILSQQRVINDTVADVALVAFWQGGAASALGGRVIDESRDIGWAALYRRTVGDRALTFELDEAGVIRDVETGSAWNAFGQAIDGELAGTQLERQVAAPHYWFAWVAFDVETIVYGVE